MTIFWPRDNNETTPAKLEILFVVIEYVAVIVIIIYYYHYNYHYHYLYYYYYYHYYYYYYYAIRLILSARTFGEQTDSAVRPVNPLELLTDSNIYLF